ncbi:MAG: hypothetical protein U1E27_03850 [Kiritimatiellia bacterium]|nr:hypothetical protein [Kiritimatiellia bacterium]
MKQNQPSESPCPSPRPLIRRALLIAFVFWALHAAGLRSYTSFLSGTIPDGHVTRSVYLGLVYILAYLAWTVLVPILLLASLILWSWKRTSIHTNRRSA